MCRHLGYLGPVTSVGDILTRGEHSLVVQSWAPTDMRCDAVANADGFGAAWWDDPTTASVHVSAMPAWGDPVIGGALASVRSGAVLAAVRSATSGMPVTPTASAPFVDGRWAFSHNGVVRGWPESLAPLAADVPVVDLLRQPAATDSAGLWSVIRHRLRDDEPGAVLRSVVADLDRTGPHSRLNFLLGDGDSLWATTVHHSLSVLADDDGVLVSSEPLDADPRWQPVPDRSLVVATRDGVTVTDL
ncbi:ergothioneine biosynthesis protein EgtC [Williamsia serinedens]|uniref:Gamma-glutamyl-hercynylcysteine sulfoxide hydrolase n=1 Tax=Williamsia serinedens TaxID=391736 RepID=A0ABT1GYM9_9NOCA|nr:ergothioneine biosynthesis protein EgtC [Williamsia serinedens]MCP2160061.1 glutamine amidotransferase [Williamsia serinedens]